MPPPTLTTHPSTRADGSALLTTPLFTILATTNGPIDVQRRDELPSEAALEVHIRPASGPSGPRERWLEHTLSSLLRSVVLVHLHPRMLVQVTLQIVEEKLGKVKGGVRDVAVLPGLVNAAFAALVDGGVGLERTVVAGLGLVDVGGEVRGKGEVTREVLRGARSVYAMVFGGRGELLLSECRGAFDGGEWEEVRGALQMEAMGAVVEGEDEVMEGGGVVGTGEPWLRRKLEEDVRAAGTWREIG